MVESGPYDSWHDLLDEENAYSLFGSRRGRRLGSLEVTASCPPEFGACVDTNTEKLAIAKAYKSRYWVGGVEGRQEQADGRPCRIDNNYYDHCLGQV